jgi:glutathione S-transferase
LDLLGDNADDQVQIATVLGVQQDLSKAYIAYVYGPKTYEEFKDEAYNALKNHLTKLSGLLGNKDWFCSKLTYVDFVLGEFFQCYSLFHEAFATEFPTLKAHQERVWNLKGTNEYVKS